VPQPKESFEECVEEAFARVMTAQGARTLLFSPGAASFGKFLHEFDRGERFNALIARMMKAFSCRFAKPSK
jgi:UDP-N-acetylmuramoylalanine-D-glutamate ligase